MTERASLPLPEGVIRAWLADHGAAANRLTALAGDVSPRRYLRLETVAGQTLVVTVYPREQIEVCRRFRRTSALLRESGVRVPELRAVDCEHGLMLLEDLGPDTLYDLRRRPLSERLPWLETAAGIARSLGRRLPSGRVAELNPPLDEALLRLELHRTVEEFLGPRGLAGGERLRVRLEDTFDTLCRRLGELAPVPCHRDFMTRNLVPLGWSGEAEPRAAAESSEGATVAVLDHQDLRLGPPLYDLASLLNDSFFPPPALEERLLADALADDAARLAYARAAAQRTLKAVGTFSAFARRGYPRHLELIPPTLGRALTHLGALPEGAEVAGELAPVWKPLIDGEADPART